MSDKDRVEYDEDELEEVMSQADVRDSDDDGDDGEASTAVDDREEQQEQQTVATGPTAEETRAIQGFCTSDALLAKLTNTYSARRKEITTSQSEAREYLMAALREANCTWMKLPISTSSANAGELEDTVGNDMPRYLRIKQTTSSKAYNEQILRIALDTLTLEHVMAKLVRAATLEEAVRDAITEQARKLRSSEKETLEFSKTDKTKSNVKSKKSKKVNSRTSTSVHSGDVVTVEAPDIVTDRVIQIHQWKEELRQLSGEYKARREEHEKKRAEHVSVIKSYFARIRRKSQRVNLAAESGGRRVCFLRQKLRQRRARVSARQVVGFLNVAVSRVLQDMSKESLCDRLSEIKSEIMASVMKSLETREYITEEVVTLDAIPTSRNSTTDTSSTRRKRQRE